MRRSFALTEEEDFLGRNVQPNQDRSIGAVPVGTPLVAELSLAGNGGIGRIDRSNEFSQGKRRWRHAAHARLEYVA
jgi:hypothetical protein